ncbi:MoaF C-terminal domain-containing protein [Amycolatopsis keratiniphila]|uniref:MoaF C-terminal domain-containing protein n=1 Tax=Amycolatopsis keratiniphila TaxID=129921 RepID=UPI001E3994BC|nr:MoaF C-terminal domain-containing protein [Amycolatopsis keratiniphila]
MRSVIGAEDVEGVPRVSQTFWSGTTDAGTPTGEVPGPSRDLIGKRNVYRYSPEHLYEHVYVSSQRYAWQCLEGVQRGHGDMDLSTVWKFQDGLYLFCFREFRIAVASVWLHDLGYALKTTGVFLGLTGDGRSEHSRAGGHIYPLGAVAYPDAQPV